MQQETMFTQPHMEKVPRSYKAHHSTSPEFCCFHSSNHQTQLYETDTSL